MSLSAEGSPAAVRDFYFIDWFQSIAIVWSKFVIGQL
jgi:hypothetical protein